MKNPNRYRPLVAILFTLLATVAVMAQQTDSSLLTLERIYSSGDSFANFWTGALAEGGSAYTTVEARPVRKKRRRDIVRYPNRYRRPHSAGFCRATDPGRTNAPCLWKYCVGQRRALLLVFTNTRKVWPPEHARRYWVLDRTSGNSVARRDGSHRR